jgi:hypothetical protein
VWTAALREELDAFRATWEAFRPDTLLTFDYLVWRNDEAATAAYKATGSLRSERGDRMLLVWLRLEQAGWTPQALERILRAVMPGEYSFMFGLDKAWKFLAGAAGMGWVPGEIADRIASVTGTGARMEAAGELPERRARRRS